MSIIVSQYCWNFPRVPWEIYCEISCLKYLTTWLLPTLYILYRKAPTVQEKKMCISLTAFPIVILFFSITKSLLLQIRYVWITACRWIVWLVFQPSVICCYNSLGDLQMWVTPEVDISFTTIILTLTISLKPQANAVLIFL